MIKNEEKIKKVAIFCLNTCIYEIKIVILPQLFNKMVFLWQQKKSMKTH